jgi:hypothetical protein
VHGAAASAAGANPDAANTMLSRANLIMPAV